MAKVIQRTFEDTTRLNKCVLTTGWRGSLHVAAGYLSMGGNYYMCRGVELPPHKVKQMHKWLGRYIEQTEQESKHE